MMCSQSARLTETVLILNRVIKGYYKVGGNGYDSSGQIVTNWTTTTEEGFDVSMSFENVVGLYNVTISDTRLFTDRMLFLNPVTDSPYAFLGGFASRTEAYGTSTFELDGSIHTFPPQSGMSPGVWQEGPSTKSIMVTEDTLYVTEITFGNTTSSSDLTRTCLDPTVT